MDVPSLLLSGAAALATSAPATSIVATGGPVTLGVAPVSVTLSSQGLAHAGGRRLALVLSDLSVSVAPGVLYRVRLDGRDLGYINFLNAANGGPATFWFDAGDAPANPLGSATVELAPQAPPAPGGQAIVGKIALLAY
ncbi:MAG TPA: hypothetical protein VMT68_02820 [Caulobacteraceae bacterium]|nr:hypothetical protein [Caulobacteraceae bacterium]